MTYDAISAAVEARDDALLDAIDRQNARSDAINERASNIAASEVDGILYGPVFTLADTLERHDLHPFEVILGPDLNLERALMDRLGASIRNEEPWALAIAKLIEPWLYDLLIDDARKTAQDEFDEIEDMEDADARR